MEHSAVAADPRWSLRKKLLFRFFFLYIVFEMTPWEMLSALFPGVDSVTYLPSFLLQNYIFQWHDPMRWSHPPTGSGDTLDDYVLKLAYLIMAVIGTIIWSVIARHRTHHTKTLGWFRIAVRYYLAFIMFSYGGMKIFALQMPYPSMVEFYRPLGDFTPMRFTWMFMGYSFSYQFVSGLLETLGGLMLLYRRTLVPGALLLVGVLANVVMLNFFYGVPVKLFSSLLLILTIFLLSDNFSSLYRFFWLGKGNTAIHYGWNPTEKWAKGLRLSLKGLFILATLGSGLLNHYKMYTEINKRPAYLLTGAFDITEFDRSGTIFTSPIDENRWNRIVMDKSYLPNTGRGNILQGTTHLETVRVSVDSLQTIKLSGSRDKGILFEGTYQELEPGVYKVEGVASSDSLRMTWVKRDDEMILPNRKFMWVLESKDF